MAPHRRLTNSEAFPIPNTQSPQLRKHYTYNAVTPSSGEEMQLQASSVVQHVQQREDHPCSKLFVEPTF